MVAGPYLLPFSSSSGSATAVGSSPAFKQSYLLFWGSHSPSQKEIGSSPFVVLGQALNCQPGKDLL